VRRGSGRRRVAWGLADQIVSSATSFLVAILAAATLSATDFGAFALGLALCILVVWLARGLSSDPLSAAHAGDDPESLARASAASATTSLLVTMGAAVVLALVSIPLFGSVLGPVLLMTAAVLPAVALQDNLRYALLVARKPRAMFFNDTLWLLLQLPMAIAVLLTAGSPALLVLAWGLSAGIAALRALRLLGIRLAPVAEARAYLDRHRTLWPFFVLDNLVYQATNVVLLIVVAALTSLAEVGGMRAAVLLFTPLTVLSRGVVAVFVPEMARRAEDPVFVRQRSLVLGLVLVPLTLAWTGAMLLIPDALGDVVLGDSWTHAEPLLLLTGLTVAVAMFSTGTVVGIRALQAGTYGFTARVVVSVVLLACASLGAVWDGAYGALLVTVLASPLQIGAWCWLLVKASRTAPRRDVQEVDR
jgi:O-antigen/teichoic acid export membrane protein